LQQTQGTVKLMCCFDDRVDPAIFDSHYIKSFYIYNYQIQSIKS